METIPYLPLSRAVLSEIIKGKLSRLENLFKQRYGAKVTIANELFDEILIVLTVQKMVRVC